MRSAVRISFTDRELDVMSVLWDVGPATVAQVRERIADDLAYTTVLTVLRTLEQKGYVSHTEDGRAHRYKPLVKREVAGRTALRRLVDKECGPTGDLTFDQRLVAVSPAGRTALRRLVDKVFDGAPELLLTQLGSDENLSDEELRRLRKLLAGRLREKKP